MKLKAPPSCSTVSHGGETLAIGRDGSIDVEDGVAIVLAAHGFTPWVASPPPFPPLPAEGEDTVEALSRQQLFALLRRRGIAVTLPVTNDELRALARGRS